jgi:hypothetical protein
MSLEALLVLLFTVFAVPGACFLVLLGAFIRALYRGWCNQRSHRLMLRAYERRLLQ